jgi:hypothetical protein
MSKTSDRLITVGLIGAGALVAAQILGRGDEGPQVPEPASGSDTAAPPVSTGGMAAPGEETTIEERSARRRAFAGVGPSNANQTDEQADESGEPPEVNLTYNEGDTTIEAGDTTREGLDRSSTATENMEAEGEETTIDERSERRREFAGVTRDEQADDSTSGGTSGSSDSGSNDDDGGGWSRDGPDNDDYEEAVEENVGARGGTGGVSGL